MRHKASSNPVLISFLYYTPSLCKWGSEEL